MNKDEKDFTLWLSAFNVRKILWAVKEPTAYSFSTKSGFQPQMLAVTKYRWSGVYLESKVIGRIQKFHEIGGETPPGA